MSKLWESDDTTGEEKGRSELHRKVEGFTVGEDHLLDRRLLPYDVRASKVHAEALVSVGVLTDKECTRLQEELGEILSQWEAGEFEIRREQEDCHTAIEQHLAERLGELGRKIHAGRSRNDQVLTAMRLLEKDGLKQVVSSVKLLAEILLDRAERFAEVPMPGYSHTRKAMLSSVGLWLASLAEMLLMDLEAVRGAWRQADRCPLGTAAGFGTSFDLPREEVARKLGFSRPLVASLAAQNTRGRVDLQVVQALEAITSTLAHFAGDLLDYTASDRGFFEIDDAFCTGSSIMPQKRNLDTAELLRARHSELAGSAQAIRMNIVGLGSGYHRDLQLAKGHVMRSFDTALEMLEMAAMIVESLRPVEEKLRAACTPELFAADRANELVREGLSFREAYRRVKEGLEEQSGEDPADNLATKTHLGAPGNPGIKLLRGELREFRLEEI